MMFIKQQDTMDCGPACLIMIAGHYGKNVEREELRRKCSLGKDGASGSYLPF